MEKPELNPKSSKSAPQPMFYYLYICTMDSYSARGRIDKKLFYYFYILRSFGIKKQSQSFQTKKYSH